VVDQYKIKDPLQIEILLNIYNRIIYFLKKLVPFLNLNKDFTLKILYEFLYFLLDDDHQIVNYNFLS